MAEYRLDKCIASHSTYSRSNVKSLLQKGLVQVNGITEYDGSRKVNPEQHEIICCGKPLICHTHVYFIVNKPVNYICATQDRTHKIVLELIPADRRKRLFPAGRLDIDSTGMVLVTDDGELAHQMLSPKHHVPKYYLLQLADDLHEEDMQKLAGGIVLADGTSCLPAQAMALPDKQALICLHEGKYHQVKRMLAALGNHVEQLHRIAIGSMLLPSDLKVGACLEILHKDVQLMLKSNDFKEMCEQIVTEFSSYSINKRR